MGNILPIQREHVEKFLVKHNRNRNNVFNISFGIILNMYVEVSVIL